MDRLPSETLNHIISYLEFSEKQKLLLVCRYWYRLIKNGNLYSSFAIKENQLEAAILFFMKSKLYRNQVRSLRLSLQEVDLKTVLTIPQIFPSMHDFRWRNNGFRAYQDEESSSSSSSTSSSNNDGDDNKVAFSADEIQSWQRLDIYGEFSRYPLATSILKNGGFCNLTKLEIDTNFGYSSCSMLVNHLSKAPKLKQFKLRHARMSLIDLEQLHCNAPQLEMLYLSNIIQLKEEEEEVQQISSIAREFTNLKMESIITPRYGCGLLSSWMTYMAIKYKDLKHLTLCGMRMCREMTPGYCEAKIAEFAAEWPNLESYHVDILPITDYILVAMNQNGVRLKKMVLEMQQQDLDAVIQHCDLIAAYQGHCLETLVINCEIFEPDSLFDTLQKFSKLKHLEIVNNFKFRRSVLCLNVLLQKLKTLETLKLSAWLISLDTSSSSVDHSQIRLKCLKLHTVVIDNHCDISSFISRSCPDLSKLSICGELLDKRKGLYVDLNQHHFTSVHLDILYNKYYKVDNRQQVIWYKFKNRVSRVSIIQTSNNATSILEYNDQPFVSIVYKHVGRLQLGDFDDWIY